MNEKIELEIRAEILLKDYETVRSKLAATGELSSETRRLSVMHFGKIGNKQLDIRVRVTNGKCEVVVKSGKLGSYDRVEVSQKIYPKQFMGMIRVMAQLGFITEVGERHTFNYDLPRGVVASLVSAGDISYLEIEKISSNEDVEINRRELNSLADNLEVSLLNSETEFNLLCGRLSQTTDWEFSADPSSYERLTNILNKYLA